MIQHIHNKMYHIEVLPPKQDSETLEENLEKFKNRYLRILESGYCACITDNTMGLLSFQGTELIEELALPVKPGQLLIHLNTFHRKDDLDNILSICKLKRIQYLLIITGDGSERIPKLRPLDINNNDVESVTSVELLKYINWKYPDTFILGVAFNPYEPEEHEFEKLKRKIKAGAAFIITQPLIGRNMVIDKLLKKHPEIPVIVEAWMSKKLHLLSEAVGYEIPQNAAYDPISNLRTLHKLYPQCGFYLSLLGFKTQFKLIRNTWI